MMAACCTREELLVLFCYQQLLCYAKRNGLSDTVLYLKDGTLAEMWFWKMSSLSASSHRDRPRSWGVPWWGKNCAVGLSVTLYNHSVKTMRLLHSFHAHGTTPVLSILSGTDPSASVIFNSRENRGNPINLSTLQILSTANTENKVTLSRW